MLVAQRTLGSIGQPCPEVSGGPTSNDLKSTCNNQKIFSLHQNENPTSGNLGAKRQKERKQHRQILEVQPSKKGNATAVREPAEAQKVAPTKIRNWKASEGRKENLWERRQLEMLAKEMNMHRFHDAPGPGPRCPCRPPHSCLLLLGTQATMGFLQFPKTLCSLSTQALCSYCSNHPDTPSSVFPAQTCHLPNQLASSCEISASLSPLPGKPSPTPTPCS